MPITYQKDSGTAAEELGSRQAGLASFLLVSKVLTILITGLGFVIVARLLGPSTYGVYTLVVAAVSSFVAVGDLGTSQALIKFPAEYLQKKLHDKVRVLLVNSFAFYLIVGIILTAIAYLSSGLIAQYALHDASLTGLLQVASLTVIASLLWTEAYAVLIGIGKGGILTKAVAVQVTVQTLLSIGLALAGFGAFAPILGLIAGLSVGFIISAVSITRATGIGIKDLRLSMAWIKKMLRFSLPLGVTGITGGLVGNFVIVLLGFYTTTAVVGNIGVTNRVASVLDTVTGSIGVALLPLFAAALTDPKLKKQIGGYYNKSIYFAFAIIAPVLFYVIILQVPVSYVIFGGIYKLAPLYIAIMCVGVFFGIIGSYTSYLMISASKTMKYLKYNILVDVIEVALLLAFLPSYGGIAFAVVVFLIIQMVFALFYLREARLLFDIRLETGKLARVLLASMISALFIFPIVFAIGGNQILTLAAALAEQLLIYPIILSSVGGINRGDLGLLEKITSKIPMVGRIIALVTGYTRKFAH